MRLARSPPCEAQTRGASDAPPPPLPALGVGLVSLEFSFAPQTRGVSDASPPPLPASLVQGFGLKSLEFRVYLPLSAYLTLLVRRSHTMTASVEAATSVGEATRKERLRMQSETSG